MKKIIAIIKPFAHQQQLFVYNDSEKVIEKTTHISEIDEEIVRLSQEYEIENIDIAGVKKFNEKIKLNIQDKLISNKFNINNIKINLI